jgi:hypothetical protein
LLFSYCKFFIFFYFHPCKYIPFYFLFSLFLFCFRLQYLFMEELIYQIFRTFILVLLIWVGNKKMNKINNITIYCRDQFLLNKYCKDPNITTKIKNKKHTKEFTFVSVRFRWCYIWKDRKQTNIFTETNNKTKKP